MDLSLIFLGAFALSLALTPAVRSLALRLDVVDHPERRKMHQVPIPLLGGSAVVVSFLLLAAATWAWMPDLLGDQREAVPPILLGAVVIALLGVYDDWRGARAGLKLFVQTGAAAIVVASGIRADLFTNPLGGSVEIGWLGIPLTVFWIVGVTNAVNLIDGLDGLAIGIGTIASLALCTVGALSDQPVVAVLALILAGAALGFLPYNTYPARIFLGDTGSMFLGFVLASLGVAGSLKASTATVLVLPIVVLGVPVFDTLWAIARRTRRRVSPFSPDRDHIHHRLVRIGLHHRHVVLVLYFVCTFLAVSAYVIVQLPYRVGFLMAGFLALAGVIGVWTLKFIEEHLEDRLATGAGSVREARATPPPESAPAAWQDGGGGREANGRQRAGYRYEVSVCEVGTFREGLSGSATFGSIAGSLKEALGRRFAVHAVGAYLLEDRNLLLVLKTEPLGGPERRMVEEALRRFFGDSAGSWADGPAFPEIRWLRSGAGDRPDAQRNARAGVR